MRVARLTAALAAIAIAVLAAACATLPQPDPTDATPSATIGSAPPTATEDSPTRRYTCGRFAFDDGILAQAGDAEQGGDPAAVALRAYLASPAADHTALPAHGWTVIGIDEVGAEFIAQGVDPLLPIVMVSVRQDRGSWKVTDGGWCDARRVLGPGINPTAWELLPGETTDPGTTGFVALVTELGCTSGKPVAGRIAGPEIRSMTDTVTVTFGVRAIDGRSPSTCQDTLPSRVEVTLPEPLGPRKLLDGGSLPARDPSAPTCCG